MKKKESVAVAKFTGTRTSELLEALKKDPQNLELTIDIFHRLSQMKGVMRSGVVDRGSNLAEILMIYGHADYTNRVFKAVEVYAKAGCYAPANFEGMILAQPMWCQDLKALMFSTCGDNRATQSVLKNIPATQVAV